jgi:hypothetical protein
MADVFYYVRRDTGPQLQLSFTDEDTGAPTNLHGGTVKMHFRAAGEESILYTKTLYVNPDPTEAAKGIAIVNWGTTDLDYEAGAYEGEIEVVLSTGIRETIYEILKFKIREDFA